MGIVVHLRNRVADDALFVDHVGDAAGVLCRCVGASAVGHADAAVGISIAAHFEFKRKCTTVEMKLNYFLPITEGKLSARGRLLRIGSSLVVGSVGGDATLA